VIVPLRLLCDNTEGGSILEMVVQMRGIKDSLSRTATGNLNNSLVVYFHDIQVAIAG
jgi:hypothetical protein